MTRADLFHSLGLTDPGSTCTSIQAHASAGRINRPHLTPSAKLRKVIPFLYRDLPGRLPALCPLSKLKGTKLRGVALALFWAAYDYHHGGRKPGAYCLHVLRRVRPGGPSFSEVAVDAMTVADDRRRARR